MNPHSPNRAGAQSLRERLKEATAAAILEAAESVFGERGLHGAKMEEVATKAGVAVGTVYNHFKDRSELLTSLMESRRAELLERIDRSLAQTEGQPFERQLTEFLEALAAHLEAHLPFLSILMQGEHDKSCPAREASKIRWSMEQVYVRVQTLVERGLAAGVLRPEDADIYATMLMGMMRGSMVHRLYYDKPDDPTVRQRIEKMVRFFLHGAGR